MHASKLNEKVYMIKQQLATMFTVIDFIWVYFVLNVLLLTRLKSKIVKSHVVDFQNLVSCF